MIASSPMLAMLPDALETSPFLGVLLAAFDTFWVVIAFAIGSAIVNWLQKRKGAGKDQESLPPHAPERTGPAPRQSKSVSWEEELRHLLEGDAPDAPTVAPPLVERRPAPPVVSTSVKARPVAAKAPARARSVRAQTPAPVSESSTARERLENLDENIRLSFDQVAAAAAAFQKASGLDEAIADRMSNVTGLHVAQAATVKHKAVLPDVAQAVAMFSHRNTARQAVIVSLILGAPRGLEEQPALF